MSLEWAAAASNGTLAWHRENPLRASAAWLAAYAVLGLITISPGHPWGDDWAQYVMHAQQLLAGKPYFATHYIYNPDLPSVGPPYYPPGTPVLLALATALSGGSIGAMKGAGFLALVAALPIIFLTLRPLVGAGLAGAAVVLFALHDKVFELRQAIGSETGYILFSFLALWLAARSGQGTGDDKRGEFWRGLLTGSAAFAAVAFRSVGIALVLAFAAHYIFNRRSLAYLGGLASGFGVLLLLQTLFLVPPTSYQAEISSPSLGLIATNAKEYFLLVGDVFRAPFKLSNALATAVLLSFAVGVTTAIWPAKPHASLWSALGDALQRVPLPVWYTLAYVAALLLSSVLRSSRYFLPILPILIAYAIVGASRAVDFLGLSRVAKPAAIALAGLYILALAVSKPKVDPEAGAMCRVCEDVYAYVRSAAPQGAVVAAAKPRAVGLMTGHPSWRWSADYSQSELSRQLTARNVKLIVLGRSGHPLGELSPTESQMRELRTHWKTVFTNAGFEVLARDEKVAN